MRNRSSEQRINEEARALFHRAGTASVAVAVDTRPKILRDRSRYTRKGRDGWSRRRAREE